MTGLERYCSRCNRLVEPQQRIECRREPCIAKIEWDRELKYNERQRWEAQRKAQAEAQDDNGNAI